MGHLLIHCPLLLVTACMLAWPAVSGLFEWLRTPQPPPTAAPPPVAPSLLAKDAQFEMVTSDEKFLAEAKQLELSQLDSCHYRVVARLRASCESLSEENLAKLGVELFNCQAEIEGRRSFPCTQEMTIKECTADMDPDTWNAYHIVSNRARSVCYAARQQLFRRRAELTVNSLISTASSQLDAMKDLKVGQLELKELTAASLDKLLEGHSTLQAQQGKLHEGQEQMEGSLRENLERLGQEKALIASGQELVAQLIQGITKRMENVSEHLQIQSSEVQDGHKAITDDLAEVRNQAQDIYQKIDHSMSEFLQYQDQTSQYYTDLMNKLERMNNTLGVMLHYLDNMEVRIEERLHMIQSYLGWAGFSRAMLLLMVPLNAVAEVNQQPALDLTSLSVLLLTLSLGHWFVTRLWACVPSKEESVPPSLLGPCNVMEPQKYTMLGPPSSTPESFRCEKNDLFEGDNLLNHDSFLSGELGISAVSPPQRRPVPEPHFPPIFGTQSQSTPRPKSPKLLSRAVVDDIPQKILGGVFDAANDSHDFGRDSRSASPTLSIVTNSSLSGRFLCNGITKAGKACKKKAIPGQEYCRVHEGGHSSYVQS
ncbi:protein brambleberry isoform X2 [Gambusia affinis]|uniref:protein brambleberry isoform X2 n=1 Tax=Gambusia affinis TaxID=33528 RepID=UPI001CDB894A|nr:protein brambleberry isoform X2 [Gambusia affinis]